MVDEANEPSSIITWELSLMKTTGKCVKFGQKFETLPPHFVTVVFQSFSLCCKHVPKYNILVYQ